MKIERGPVEWLGKYCKFWCLFSRKYLDKHEKVCYTMGTIIRGGVKMNEIEIVKSLMKAKGKSSLYIAETLWGEGTPASKVSNRLQSKTMNVETLIRILDVLECELIIRDKVGDKQSHVVANDNRQSVKVYRKKEGEN